VSTAHDALPRGALSVWLAQRLAQEAGGPVDDLEVGDFETPSVGQSNDTVLFAVTWTEGSARHTAELVARRQPRSHQLFLGADVLRESSVLRALERGSGVPVPHVMWQEPDPAVLGAPFFVMSRVHGRVPSGKPSIHSVGWLPGLEPVQQRRLWESAMRCLVAVHEVDWRTTHEFLLDDDPSSASVDGHLRWLESWYEWTTRGRAYPITDAALAYLREHSGQIEAYDSVLVWGDARIGNMIFDDDLTVAAAIDWEVACIGSPSLDVAHWLLFDEFATVGAGVPRLAGFPDRDTTVARYEELSGRTLWDLEYFEIMQGFFLAITLIRQADLAVERGDLAAGTRMGHDNSVTQILARKLGLEVPELAADYLAHRRPTGGDGRT
jgi:aminoglycoside phosphotransferase (APT) family kinase protein